MFSTQDNNNNVENINEISTDDVHDGSDVNDIPRPSSAQPSLENADRSAKVSFGSLEIEEVESTTTIAEGNSNLVRILKKSLKFGICAATFLILFTAATVHFAMKKNRKFADEMCSGYGFVLTVSVVVMVFFSVKFLLKRYGYRVVFWQDGRYDDLFRSLRLIIFVFTILGSLLFIMIDSRNNVLARFQPFLGLLLFVLIGAFASKSSVDISWELVSRCIFMQIVLGLLVIRWWVGRAVLRCLSDKISTLLSFADVGAEFVYGNEIVNKQKALAFQALSAIFFLSFLTNVLYYWGVMQKIVAFAGKFFEKSLGTSRCESAATSANIFFSQSDTLVLLRPYLERRKMTNSEIHAIMTSGFATVSGSLLAAYVSLGARAEDIVTASLLSAPASFCFAKLLFPDDEHERDFDDDEGSDVTDKNFEDDDDDYDYDDTFEKFNKFSSALDAGIAGASSAVEIVWMLIANLIAFVALVSFINALLGWLGWLVTEHCDVYPSRACSSWSLESIAGILFAPISFLLGVSWEECEKVGQVFRHMIKARSPFQTLLFFSS